MKLVLTGAAGRLSSYLREPLAKLADELVSTDIADDIGTPYSGETYIKGDLTSLDDMTKVLEGAEDNHAWRDLRIWATVLIMVQLLIYYLFS